MFKNHAHLRSKNLNPAPDPFEVDANEDRLKPTDEWIDRQIDKWFEEEEKKVKEEKIRLGKTNEEVFASLNALKMLRLNRVFEKMGGRKEKQFVTDFQSWLIGAGREEDHKFTPWGRNPLKFPDVATYMKSFVDKRWDFQKKLAHLRLTGPTNLGDAWLYYKYLVRGQPVIENSPDYLSEFAMWSEEPPFRDEKNFKKIQGRDGNLYEGPDSGLPKYKPYWETPTSWAVPQDKHEWIDVHDPAKTKNLPYIPGRKDDSTGALITPQTDPSAPNTTSLNRAPVGSRSTVNTYATAAPEEEPDPLQNNRRARTSQEVQDETPDQTETNTSKVDLGAPVTSPPQTQQKKPEEQQQKPG
jgi:hypothetical protein